MPYTLAPVEPHRRWFTGLHWSFSSFPLLNAWPFHSKNKSGAYFKAALQSCHLPNTSERFVKIRMPSVWFEFCHRDLDLESWDPYRSVQEKCSVLSFQGALMYGLHNCKLYLNIPVYRITSEELNHFNGKQSPPTSWYAHSGILSWAGCYITWVILLMWR